MRSNQQQQLSKSTSEVESATAEFARKLIVWLQFSNAEKDLLDSVCDPGLGGRHRAAAVVGPAGIHSDCSGGLVGGVPKRVVLKR